MTCGVSGIMDSVGKRRANGRTHMRFKVPPTRPPVRRNKRQNDARGDPLTICCRILMCRRHLSFQSPDRRRRRGQTAWICSPLEGRTGVTGWGGEREKEGGGADTTASSPTISKIVDTERKLFLTDKAPFVLSTFTFTPSVSVCSRWKKKRSLSVILFLPPVCLRSIRM